GSVRVSLSGEEAAIEGFPVDDIAFADGWSIAFDKVLVSVVEVRLEASDGDRATLDVDPVVADLHLGDPVAWTFDAVPARRWDRVAYRYAPPTMSARRVNAVSDADVAAMVSGGHALWIEGVASRGAERVAFAFGFDLDVDNVRCESGVDDTQGLVVREGALTEAELTFHLDHLFFDSYATDDPALRFDAMAAVATDGALSLDDLIAQSITDVRDAEGEPLTDDGVPVVYDPGDLSLAAPNLREFIRAAATTIGHFQGEGHCDYVVR
ncbi:MAG: hypothetical protein KF901_20545, partial [Myxococcales bacterium]|nr:hypothetical protein [Myxococcales bacterium]